MGSQRIAIGVVVVALLAGSGAACSSSPSAQRTRTAGSSPRIVASTNIYGDLARRLVGSTGRVDTVLSDPGVDPHDYVADARDLLALSRADVVVMNGGGYDAFMETLLKSENIPATRVIDAVEIAGDAATNEHVFFDVRVMASVTERLAEMLVRSDPRNETRYRAAADDLQEDLTRLDAAQRALAVRHGGAPVLVTDPAPLLLVEACGLVDRTPEGFATGVEEGEGVPPRVLGEAIDAVRRHRVDMVVTNPASLDAQVARVLAAARTAGIPVVEISEVLPEDRTYVSWMEENLTSLASALGGRR